MLSECYCWLAIPFPSSLRPELTVVPPNKQRGLSLCENHWEEWNGSYKWPVNSWRVQCALFWQVPMPIRKILCWITVANHWMLMQLSSGVNIVWKKCHFKWSLIIWFMDQARHIHVICLNSKTPKQQIWLLSKTSILKQTFWFSCWEWLCLCSTQLLLGKDTYHIWPKNAMHITLMIEAVRQPWQ